MGHHRYRVTRLVIAAALALVVWLSACIQPAGESPRAFLSPLGRNSVYFPIAANSPCLRTPAAAQFFALLAADGRQQRSEWHCNRFLVQAAQVRAESLAGGGYWAHCDPAGVCPNTVARQAGCPLPSNYGNGNQIESLVAGPSVVEIAYAAVTSSADHARHLFGQNEFFRGQADYGIAVLNAPGSVWGVYYVIMIGTCE